MNRNSFSFAALFLFLILTSCNSSENKASVPAAVDTAKTTGLKAKYVCPMDSDVVSDHPDTCRKCGMDLEEVK